MAVAMTTVSVIEPVTGETSVGAHTAYIGSADRLPGRTGQAGIRVDRSRACAHPGTTSGCKHPVCDFRACRNPQSRPLLRHRIPVVGHTPSVVFLPLPGTTPSLPPEPSSLTASSPSQLIAAPGLTAP